MATDAKCFLNYAERGFMNQGYFYSSNWEVWSWFWLLRWAEASYDVAPEQGEVK